MFPLQFSFLQKPYLNLVRNPILIRQIKSKQKHKTIGCYAVFSQYIKKKKKKKEKQTHRKTHVLMDCFVCLDVVPMHPVSSRNG